MYELIIGTTGSLIAAIIAVLSLKYYRKYKLYEINKSLPIVDSKVAVMLFVENKDFTNVLKTIKEETPNHDYFVKYKGDRGESSFSYDFHLKQDKDKIAQVEIMAFHFDKK